MLITAMLGIEINFFVFIKLRDHRKILQKLGPLRDKLLTERDEILYNNITQISKSQQLKVLGVELIPFL